MVDQVFRDEELLKPFNFSKKLLPTNTDCLRFVLSRTHMKAREMSHKEAVSLMAKCIHEIWTAADCCPFSQKYITTLFQSQVWDTYKYTQREKCLPGDTVSAKRSHKKDPSKTKEIVEPVRKSQRRNTPLSSPTRSSAVKSPSVETVKHTPPNKVTRATATTSLREKWDLFWV